MTEAIYVNVGVGIGAGILIGGEVYRGASGAAGEVDICRSPTRSGAGGDRRRGGFSPGQPAETRRAEIVDELLERLARRVPRRRSC